MPSPRRLRLLLLAAVGIAVLILFYTSRLEGASTSDGAAPKDFYQKTVNAMDDQKSSGKAQGGSPLKPADRDRDGDIDVDDEIMGVEMQERLKAAENKAKELANEKAGLRPDPPSNIIGVGSSADGQDASSDEDSPVVEEERDTESELNSILKKSPSKSPGTS